MSNDATNFRAARAENHRTVFLASLHFSKSVILHPSGSPERTIVAMEHPPDEDLGTDGMTIDSRKLLEFTIGRDPDAVDDDGNTIGGIRDEELEMGLILVVDGARYAWTGRVINQTDYSYRLEFRRRGVVSTNTQSRSA